MPKGKTNSVEYRREADRARRLAGKASDGVSRQNLLDSAEKYEELAEDPAGAVAASAKSGAAFSSR